MSADAKTDEIPAIDRSSIERSLGRPVLDLIDIIAREARGSEQSLYLVGGVLRDVILGCGKPDLDFALEADAIRFAKALAERYGGGTSAHPAFGTATWTLDAAAARRLSLNFDEIPSRIDFVRARAERYAGPAALPTVRPGTIEQDLKRRDFNINALALQLSPASASWRLRDVCGGLDDLHAGIIRALHPQSFVDDPTRILRAQKFALRLGFDIEADTAAWMRSALAMLGRITGPRLRNEIDLILDEPRAGEILLRLQATGALAQIHAAFRLSEELPELLRRCDVAEPPWQDGAADRRALKWSLLLHEAGETDARAFCDRLGLPKSISKPLVASARLSAQVEKLDKHDVQPSRITRLLDGMPETAIRAAWLRAADQPARQKILEAYMQRWRIQRPTVNGDDLRALGLAQGPAYRRILDRLRFAWIDGEIQTADEEANLLRLLLAEGG